MKHGRSGLKKAILLVIVLTMIMSAIPAGASAMLTGDGSEGNPYRIGSATDFQLMGSLINGDNLSYGDKHYILTQDISLPAPEVGYKNFESIVEFSGTFDGQGYKIDGLVSDQSMVPTSITPEGISFASVFGFLFSGAEVKNLSFSNVVLNDYEVSAVAYSVEAGARLENISVDGSLTGQELSAGLALHNYGEAVNCHNLASITGNAAAGLILVNLGSIISCSNEGAVYAPEYAGGITAMNIGTISQTVNSGDISALNKAGGITAEMASIIDLKSSDLNTYDFEASYAMPEVAPVISGCLNTGEISNAAFMIPDSMEPAIDFGYTSYLGGLVGFAEGELNIENSLNRGSVTGNSYNDQRLGGLVGSAYRFNVENSGNEGDIVFLTYSMAGGLVGYTGNLSVVNSYNTGDLMINGLSSDMKSFELAPNGRSFAQAGGLAGMVYQQYDNLSLLIKNSYNSGAYILNEIVYRAAVEESSADFGNLVGTVMFIEDPLYEKSITIEDSYWLDQGISYGPIAIEDTLYIQSIEPEAGSAGSLATFTDNNGVLTPLADNEIIDSQTSLLSALNTWTANENETSETDYLFWGSLTDTNDGYPYFATEIIVTLDADGGQAGLTGKSGRPGLLYGQDSSGRTELLPSAVRSGFTFAGWYDGKAEGSGKITDQTVINNSEDHTIYARWNPFVYINRDTATGITASGLEQNIRIPESELSGASEIRIFIKVQELGAAGGVLNEEAGKKLADQGHLLLGLYDISIFKRITSADGTYRDLAVPAEDILGDLTVRIPIAADQADKQNLAVAYLDDEGRINYPDTTRLTLDGVEYLQFVTNHFSHYAVIEQDAIPLVDLNPDEMTKTGEQSPAIWPVFIIAGLGALLLLKSKIKSTSKG